MPFDSPTNTPYRDASPAGSDWSSASRDSKRRRVDSPGTRGSSPGASNGGSSTGGSGPRKGAFKPKLSRLKQEILTEEEYEGAVSDIIKKNFFPQLAEMDARNELMAAVESRNEDRIEESVRRMREIVTPTPRRRARANMTPGRTPFGTEPSDTPTYFSETPSRFTPRASTAQSTSNQDALSDMTLAAFQSAYTSEDNSSFLDLLHISNEERKEKYKWAWDAEAKANTKAIEARKERELLVEGTRKMLAASADGSIRMIEGAPGRPGERKLLIDKKIVGAGGGGRGMIEAGESAGRLLITDGNGRTGQKDEAGKESGFVDWDKPTVEEEEENKELAEDQKQVKVDTWKFTNRNSLMFAPDANSASGAGPAPGPEPEGTVQGEPKGIRYHATRLDHIEKAAPGTLSPTRSRINAAISGTPYPSSSKTGPDTPKVGGFSFVDALPTPRASTIPADALKDLMSWGTIESTPVALRSAGSVARNVLGEGGGPFAIRETSKREEMAREMAKSAKRNLADRKRGQASSSSGGLRRKVLDSVRGSLDGGSTPRSPRGGGELSPAARNLLSKTSHGRVLDRGLAASPGWKEQEEDRQKSLRAKARAREVESRDMLRRTKWDNSPASTIGFEPDQPRGLPSNQ
ncbi:hypothetical protein T439DRAFT_134179 [Meredithblackwellia eburnea MCA 4105]